MAVIVAVPAFLPTTTPLLLTVATLVLLDDQVTVLLATPAGETVAIRRCESPTYMNTVFSLIDTLVGSAFLTVIVAIAVFPM